MEAANDRLEHAFADILTFVEGHRVDRRAASNIRMVNDPFGSIAALAPEYEAGIVVSQDSDNVLRLLGSRHGLAECK